MIMTERQKKFCTAYIENGGNVRQAALSAGYTENTASIQAYRMIRHPKIKAAIEKGIQRLKDNNLGITFTLEEKLKKLKLVTERGIPDDEAKAELVDARKTQLALTAIAESNKMQGHLSAEKHISVNVNADVDVNTAKDLFSRLLIENQKDF